MPIILGQEFKCFASTLRENIKLIKNTGKLLAGIKFSEAEDLIEANSYMTAFVIY